MITQSTLFYVLSSLVTGGVAIYFLLCLLIYFQSKQKSFLYYGLYNFFLLTYLITKSPFLSKTLIPFLKAHDWTSYNWYSQVVYNSLLFLFYQAFLDLDQHYPRFNRILHRYLVIQLSSATVLFLYTLLTGNHWIFTTYFIYVFIPIVSGFVFYALYIAWRIPNRLGYFIITGVVLYNVFAYFSLYQSFHHSIATEPLNFFFIAILLESIVFILGLGYKVKLIYQDRLNTQLKIIEEQRVNQELRTSHQKVLEAELASKINDLKEALQKSEAEKVTTLRLQFENEVNILKLESLRSQMNPHFIFNALNSIKVYLIENNKEQAIYYLNKFSKLIRKILESSRNDSITLTEELEIIELYMRIENIRFDNQIDFSITQDEKVGLPTVKIPSLLLQPFIENAIWHGLMLKEGEKKISIHVGVQDSRVVLTISDNGIGREKAREHREKKSFKKESLGLEFSRERLSYFNKKTESNYSFNIEDLEEGTKVVFLF
ncbi:sensor histidine kinase [Flavobacterium stagni]|uniref:Histidine kinase n=1 Tax=Flavobacterium stagni TaxID=2506421 RepID=A0A4Q1K4X4_9FLAO|nr:histidine kinase [Flavobacterium stagni]RXR20204.1 hypothetical protein EQG61_13215 [Flavobacterium stagni]